MKVFVVKRTDECYDCGFYNSKVLGYFSSKEKAEEALDELYTRVYNHNDLAKTDHEILTYDLDKSLVDENKFKEMIKNSESDAYVLEAQRQYIIRGKRKLPG